VSDISLPHTKWQRLTTRRYDFNFPAQPLLSDLVDLYFKHENIYIPLLHRPTFEKQLADGLSMRDDSFAATVLLVCALASRWSEDPNIAKDGWACGRKWFEQATSMDDRLFGQANLYDLQYYSLAVLYLIGSSSAPQLCWRFVVVGLRLAQDIGVHRRQALIEPPSVERELFKRAFWVLVYLDHLVSSWMGRTSIVEYDELDIDQLLEVDDEFWDHPTHPFRQPANRPSYVTYFNNVLRLTHILTLGLRYLYPLNKVRVLFPIDDTWKESLVAELDSALNQWLNGLPEHLRWDPTKKEPVFFDQSVAIYTAYYQLQILIHRPLVPILRKSAPTKYLSLAICTNAARSCANIVDIQRQRNGTLPAFVNVPGVFASAIVMLLNIWSSKRKGLIPHSGSSREMVYVQKCMQVVKLCETRDVLAELASVGGLTRADLKDPTLHSPNVSPSNDIPLEEEIQQISHPSVNIPKLDTPISPSSFKTSPSYTEGYIDPAQASCELECMMDLLDSNVWANAPGGLEMDAWGIYLDDFYGMTQGDVERIDSNI
ncbi:fungal-specific transcription factor domain-containing protein, partial [Favolaschia claudopus]